MPPVFHDDPDRAMVFPPFEERDVISPPVFTLSLRNVKLTGFRTILSSEGFFTNDLGHASEEREQGFEKGLRTSEELTGLKFDTTDNAFKLDSNVQEATHLEGPVVVLTSAEAGNYGSFVFRELVKLINLYGIPPDWRFLLHISIDTFIQFLALAGVPENRIIRQEPRQSYYIDQAIIPCIRNPFTYMDHATSEFYRRLRLQCDEDIGRTRIYVARSSINSTRKAGRVMLNEPELIRQLQSLDFYIVEPEYLTAAQQVATFANAELVVGPSGSGMFNAAFCRPGTKIIDIESEPHWVFQLSCLFASLGLPYGIFEASAVNRDWSVHHKPFHVNIDALVQRVLSF
jgi:capsular polysaccharide biosynthesis protein